MHSKLQSSLHSVAQIMAECAELLPTAILAASEKMAATLKRGGKVMFCGNGGSAADSQHMAAELTVRLSSRFDRPALFGLDLTANSSELTACANDYSFVDVFARKVEACAQAGDMLVGISTSGNSKNIIKAFDVAQQLGVTTLLLSGQDGGHLGSLADYSLLAPSDNVMRVQEAHITFGHLMIETVEEILFGNGEC